MPYTLNGVALPYSLLWTNEQEWTPYVQALDYSLTGALIVERAVKQAGRPIRLAGAEDRAWVSQATMDALRALLNTDPLTLITPDGRSFTVSWDHAGPPIVATPVRSRWPDAAQKYAAVVLSLIEV